MQAVQVLGLPVFSAGASRLASLVLSTDLQWVELLMVCIRYALVGLRMVCILVDSCLLVLQMIFDYLLECSVCLVRPAVLDRVFL